MYTSTTVPVRHISTKYPITMSGQQDRTTTGPTRVGTDLFPGTLLKGHLPMLIRTLCLLLVVYIFQSFLTHSQTTNNVGNQMLTEDQALSTLRSRSTN